MARCYPAGGNRTEMSRKRSLTPRRSCWLRIASLVFFAGALSAAGSVAAARTPDPLAAYGSPQPPAVSSSASADAWTVASSWSMAPVEDGIAFSAIATDPVQLGASISASPEGPAPESDGSFVLDAPEGAAGRGF